MFWDIYRDWPDISILASSCEKVLQISKLFLADTRTSIVESLPKKEDGYQYIIQIYLKRLKSI